MSIIGVADLSASSQLNQFTSVAELRSQMGVGNGTSPVVYNVKDPAYGAVGVGTTDDTAAIQSAANAAIAAKGVLYFPAGTYLVTNQINLTSIAAVNNASPFGLTIAGAAGMGSVIKSNQTAGQLFNFDAGASTDLQVHMRDLVCYDVGNGGVGKGTIALLLGQMSRYSTFERIRLYGFNVGVRFRRQTYGIDFRDLYIRGCGNNALYVDSGTLGAGVITEVRFFGGYWDDNGANCANGGSYIGSINLTNAQEWKFYGVVMEGNTGGGITLTGCQNILFDHCRFEETLVQFGSSGHIHNIDTTSRNIVFRGGQMAYDKNGADGLKNYQLVNASGGPVLFDHVNFVESSNQNPTDMFGSTPSTTQVECINCVVGNGSGTNQVQIPQRYNGRWTGGKSDTVGSAAPASGTYAVGDRVRNNAPAVGAVKAWVCTQAGTPGTWEPEGVVPGTSADRGDASVTIVAGTDASTQKFNTPLTVGRTVTLSTTGAWNGAKFRIVRTAAATGASTLTVGSKTLAVGQFIDVEYDGSAWNEVAFGSL